MLYAKPTRGRKKVYNMKTIISITVCICICLSASSCNFPIPPPPKAVEPAAAPKIVEPAPAPTVQKAPVVKPSIGYKITGGVVCVTLNAKGKEMLKSGRYVVHIQYNYCYDIMTSTGRTFGQFPPTCQNPTAVGLYDTTTGKYMCSAQIR